MPHTTRRKKPPAHAKRVALESDDGWTTITTTSAVPSRWKAHPGSSRPAIAPADVPPSYMLQHLQADREHHAGIWRASTCCQAASALLLGARPSLSSRKEIQRCVCVGLGSFTDNKSRRAALYQLSAFLSCLETLGNHAENVHAQDPAFNALDRALLSSLHISVVEHPQAFDLIDASTFVFAPHCERSFFYPGMEGKDPALVVCNSFEDVVDGYCLPFIAPRAE